MDDDRVVPCTVLPSMNIDCGGITHLDVEQQIELPASLDEFCILFGVTPD